MTINVTDIKLLESERLTDADNGGGRMTGSVVDSGEVNNVFPDISRLDRTYGRLALRKLYMAIQSENTDVYLGAHVIVTDPPDDTRVATTIFSTRSTTDERSAAQDRIESYLARGPLSPFLLYGTQPEGTKAITLLGRIETPVPGVGEVLVLSVENAEGVVSSEQYVRVADVTEESRTFTDGAGDFTRKVVTLALTSALRQVFVGAEASRFSVQSVPTKVRETTIADASRYYGITRLVSPALSGALELAVESIFSQLVPSTTREVAFAGARPGLTLNFVPIAGPRSDNLSGTDPGVLPRGVVPGSITSGSSGLSNDDGTGALRSGTTVIGAIDYESGRLSGRGFSSVSYTPGVAIQRNSYTTGVLITVGNQGTVYVQALPVPPAPKTTRVDYRYLGKWYTLRDVNGTGQLVGGSPGEGGGTVDYVTGNVVVTLGALPDIDSMLIFSAGQNTDFVQRSGTVIATAPRVEFTLSDPVDDATAIAFSWLSGGVARTASAAATTGVITGDASGQAYFADGFISFAPTANAWPDSNSVLQVTYTKATGARGSVTGTTSNNVITFQLPAQALPVRPGAFLARIPALVAGKQIELYIKDDGAGTIIEAPDRKIRNWNGAVAGGSINYSTGAVSVQLGIVQWTGALFMTPSTAAWGDASTQVQANASVLVQHWTGTVAAGSDVETEAVTFPGISIYLGAGYTDDIVPGSVWFEWGGKEYIDRQGRIFRDMSPATGAATDAGSIDYTTGEVRLDNWGTTTGGAATIRTLLSTRGTLGVLSIIFRTPGSPIRPGSLYLQAVRADTGALITGVSTQQGPINGAKMRGVAEHDMGWVQVYFGEYVTAAGNEMEPWYDAATIVSGNVWKPIPVNPDTITFNTVVLTNLPLDADLLGIDPVRLPQTGKVPILRDGDVIVVHEPQSFTLPGGLTAGQVVALPHDGIDQLVLVDVQGDPVPATKYTANVDTGVVTMSTPLDLAGFTQPLQARYALEDMVLVSSVELSGKISLVSPLTRDYSDDALVSSALLFGDLQAENPVFFTQQTWTAVWADARIGSTTTAQYNRTLYPLELINKNAISERWSLIFNGPTTGVIVGETLGQIGTFNTTSDAQPLNPVTGEPYFVLRATGWGSGWSTGNVLRINTLGPNAPIWVARTVLPGATALADDSLSLQLRGDAD